MELGEEEGSSALMYFDLQHIAAATADALRFKILSHYLAVAGEPN